MNNIHITEWKKSKSGIHFFRLVGNCLHFRSPIDGQISYKEIESECEITLDLTRMFPNMDSGVVNFQGQSHIFPILTHSASSTVGDCLRGDMTKAQKKRMEELAEEEHKNIDSSLMVKWEFVAAYKSGYQTAMKEAEVLIEAITDLVHRIELNGGLGEYKGGKAFALTSAIEAIKKWHGK